MSLLLVFVAIAVAGAAIALSLGRLRGLGTRGPGRGAPPGWERGGASEVDAMAEPLANVPPVLLPPDAGTKDIAELRFSIAFRGYRMDQVDAVLESLARDIRARDALLAELRERDGEAGGR